MSVSVTELETKICRDCDMEFPLFMFPKSKTHSFGRTIYCKKCHSNRVMESNKKRYARDPVYRARQNLNSRNRYYGMSHLTTMEMAEIELRE